MIGSNNHRITAMVFHLGFRVTETGQVLTPAGTFRVPSFRPKTKLAPNTLYGTFSVKLDGKHSSCKVHQLAAYQKFGDAAFDGSIQVRHLNGDSTDNSLANIAIGTPSENAFDRPPAERKRMALNAANATRKLTQEQALELVEMRRNGASLKTCGDRFGLYKSTVSELMQGKLYSDLTGIPFTPRKSAGRAA